VIRFGLADFGPGATPLVRHTKFGGQCLSWVLRPRALPWRWAARSGVVQPKPRPLTRGALPTSALARSGTPRASAALQYSQSFGQRGGAFALLRSFYVFRFPALFTIRHVEKIILICLLVALIIFIASWSNR
jgi:hypothetical protein